MQNGLATDVLLGLLDVPEPGIGGTELQERLAAHGRPARSDQLLAALLRLETIDHVAVRRDAGFRFALTDAGRVRAHELAGGRPVHVRLLMADLVGYVAFTAAHGDEAAHEAARCLARVASGAIRSRGGEIVKGLGDGFLAWLPPDADPRAVMTEIAQACPLPSGDPWPMRAASHVGHPIRFGGDLFGTDVNLVARLCAAAEPGQLVLSDVADAAAERLEVRGMTAPVAVVRLAIA